MTNIFAGSFFDPLGKRQMIPTGIANPRLKTTSVNDTIRNHLHKTQMMLDKQRVKSLGMYR